MEEPKLNVIDLGFKRTQFVNIMIFQFNSKIGDWKVDNGLYFPDEKFKFKEIIFSALDKAKAEGVDLIVFPELSVPKECLSSIKRWSSKNKTIVIAGSHYDFSINKERISKCPVIFNNQIFYTEKIIVAPDERPFYKNNGIVSGNQISIFKNTPVGNFAILICSDNLLDDVKNKIKNEPLDFWIVIAFQKNSKWHFNRINNDVESTIDSRYIIYSNNMVETFADGSTSFFGITEKIALDKFESLNLKKKEYSRNIITLDNDNDYAVLKVDINNKRPKKDRLPGDERNVILESIGSLIVENDLNTNKKDIEQDMRNNINNETILHDYHQFVVNNYLKQNLFLVENINEELFLKYSNAFIPVIKINKGEESLTNNSDNIFNRLFHFIECNHTNNPILIHGFAGCGKAYFLSVLYLYIYQKCIENNLSKIPIFINLHHYNKVIYNKSTRSIELEAKRKLDNDLNPIFTYLNGITDKEILFIIDGLDEFNFLKVEIDDYFFQKINSLKTKPRIIGLRKHHSNSRIFGYLETPKIDLELIGIKIDSDEFSKFTDALIPLETSTTNITPDQIKRLVLEKLLQFKIEEVDFFLLMLMIKGVKSEFGYGRAKTLSEFYQTYLRQNNYDINIGAELAFKMFNKQGDIETKEKNQKEWWLIQKHISIRDYLVATKIVNKLVKYNSKNNEVFSFVYPHKLNVFCKEIINKDANIQNSVYKAIIALFETIDINAKTHFCYLLGRFNDETLKGKAKNYLINLKNNLNDEIEQRIPSNSMTPLKDEEQKLLLYYRTIYISLTYIGDKSASSEYIKHLLNNRYFDNLNRGFHLEYYQDILFSSDATSLKHDDPLCDFSLTYNRLSGKIKNALLSKKFYDLFEIELYTLCSLAQHRHSNGNLDDDKREGILNLIDLTLENHGKLYYDLFVYVKFIKSKLEINGKFKIASFTKDLYKLKKIKRQGWVERKIENPESVAEHIYFTYIIALVHLPSEIENKPSYNKEKVLNMLLIHDIAESEIGDLTPRKRNEAILAKEKRHMEYLSLLGTYDGLSNSNQLIELFNDFNSEKDFNGEVARDIDKLENLFQLYIYYKEEGKGNEKDFNEFKNDLKEKIKTNIGKTIMQQIEDLFNISD